MLRGNRVNVVAKTTGRWKMRQLSFEFRPPWVARWIVETPETMPRVPGKRRDRDGLNKIVSRNA